MRNGAMLKVSSFRTFVLLLTLASFSSLLRAVDSPDDRQITDPKSIASSVNPVAGPVPIAQLYYTRNTFGPAWSPDGTEVVFTTNLTGRLNLWKVSAAGGFPIQLLQSEDRQSGAVWSPDGKWIVFDQDFGGGELYDLFAVSRDGGELINLTNTPDISESSAHWSPDGSMIALEYRPKSASAVNIALLDWKTRAVHNLTNEQTGNREWYRPIWSPDGKTIYATRANAGFTDSDVYRVDVASGNTENLTPHQGDILYSASSVAPDGKTLLISSNEKGGFENVALLDVASKQRTWVTDLKWEARGGDFSPDGKSFTYVVNADGRTDIFMVERKSGRKEKLTFPEGITVPDGDPRAFSPKGDRLLVSHQSSTEPADLWIFDIASRKTKQLTYSAVASLNPSRLPASQLVHYKTFDGKTISAFLWMPFNLKRDGTNPGIVLPHGGPTGQTVDSFTKSAAALASRGYVCIAPNVRGSTGYGMEFQRANYKDLGGGDLQDEVYAARFLAETGYVDPAKIGITGGSYGGYMAMIAIGRTPDTWAAAVELFGITDWLTEQEHEEPTLQQYDQSILGDPVKDRKSYEDASPIKYFKNAKAPLLILQGTNDIRDPKEEAEQAETILKQAGKVVDAHYYPDEGHGFAKRENQIDAMQRTVDWFDRYLKNRQP
ncbi:MAG TPA: S9 family peptidase [Candidatus Sulfotelmatobacter sp.]|nr:S9 family peptidase [Candidatus Sulfotelmatobacter sp.]